LISLNCTHPDLIDFIKVKSDTTKIQNANISVQVTDAFYKAAKNDDDWEMSFEIPEVKKGQKVYIDVHSTDLDSKYDKEKKKWYYIAKKHRPYEKISKTAKAREILELIAKGMCQYGEPGIQNIDIAKKFSNSDYVYDPDDVYDTRCISSNACCIVGDTIILTNKGLKTIKDVFDNIEQYKDTLMIMSRNLKNEFEFKPLKNAWQQRNDITVDLEFTNAKLECSADHKILTKNRGYVEAVNLTNDDDIIVFENFDKLVAVKINSTIKPLYDIEVQDNHNFVANNIVIKNSEQYLSRDGSCILSSLNAGKFSPDLETYEEELAIISPSMTRFLDNVNEMELRECTYSTPFQRMGIEKLRRTGAGYTNLAGWLFKHDMEYGSDEANKVIEKFTERFNYHLYKTSIELGKEKGNFELFNREKFEKSPFVKRMMKLGLEFHHMRVCTCSSVAPAGSISLMFRNTVFSYGIEPAFGLYYWKRTRISGKYEYYFVVPSVVRELLASKGIIIPIESDTIKDTFDGEIGKPIAEFIDKHVKELGIHFKQSTEISPFQKLDLMARVMKWIDSSISVTYMLPETANWKDVYDFILLAHEKGVKSIAAFPDKKMYGIVSQIPFKALATKLKKDNVDIHNQNFTVEEIKELDDELHIRSSLAGSIGETHVDAQKRPKSLPCDIHHIRVTKKLDKIRSFEYLVVIGLFDGNKPYEAFATENGILNKAYSKGTVTKVNRGRYDLLLEDGTKIENLTKNSTEHEDALTRLVSCSLRHNVPLIYVVEQLDKVEGDMLCFAKGISKALKKYVIDGIKIKGQTCPDCGNDSLERSAGCISCTLCNWSKCN
jgi:ribonucleotide reductase alpha subunit